MHMGDKVIEPINQIAKWFESEDLPVVFTRDWHPPDHSSFIENGGIWPTHCVKGTKGAELHPSLYFPSVSILVSKATSTTKEAYSGFQGTGLASTLRDMGVERLIVTGLATDYCVKNTVIDALKLGFSVQVVREAILAVNVNEGDGEIAIKEMVANGAQLVSLADVL